MVGCYSPAPSYPRSMYTRCPECQTAFRITIAQLKARDGLVRCGRCDAMFRADLRLFAPPAARGEHADDADSQMYIDLGGSDADASSEADVPVVSDLSPPPRRRWARAAWVAAA